MPRASFRGLLSDRDPSIVLPGSVAIAPKRFWMFSQNRIMQYAPYAANQH
jgi:hypothetical protein